MLKTKKAQKRKKDILSQIELDTERSESFNEFMEKLYGMLDKVSREYIADSLNNEWECNVTLAPTHKGKSGLFIKVDFEGIGIEEYFDARKSWTGPFSSHDLDPEGLDEAQALVKALRTYADEIEQKIGGRA